MNPKEEYWKLVESEKHFNTIQAGIRNRASTWILAAFAAIAVLINVSEKTSWIIPGSVLIGLVCLMATIGLLLLWINDQLVYQKLLGSVFMLGLKWEHDNPDFPPIRAMMMYSSGGKGMSGWMTLYYTIPMASFLVISIAITLLREHFEKSNTAFSPNSTIWTLTLICLIQAGISVWVQRKKSRNSIEELAKNFGDNEFTQMFSKKDEAFNKYKEVMERHVTDKKIAREFHS